MGGRACAVEGDRVRGVLQHGRRGRPRHVAAQDCRPRHLHRPRQPRKTRAGTVRYSILYRNTVYTLFMRHFGTELR